MVLLSCYFKYLCVQTILNFPLVLLLMPFSLNTFIQGQVHLQRRSHRLDSAPAACSLVGGVRGAFMSGFGCRLRETWGGEAVVTENGSCFLSPTLAAHGNNRIYWMSCIPALHAAPTPLCRTSINEIVKDSYCIQTRDTNVVCSFSPILSIFFFLDLSSSMESLDSVHSSF